MQENSINSDHQNILLIWAGQLLIFSLKCDLHDLLILRGEFIKRMTELGIPADESFQKKAFLSGVSAFCLILKKRFSLQDDAAELLDQKLKSFAEAFWDGEGMEKPLSELRVTDAWSGLSSCLSKFPMPLSLLDYSLDIILPVVTSEQVKKVCLLTDKLFSDKSSDTLIDEIDGSLEEMTCHLCFNSNLDTVPCQELKLAILMHLPHDDKDFSMKKGYLFKILQSKYSHWEAK